MTATGAHDQLLRAVFRFDQRDLEMNRAGELSPAQRAIFDQSPTGGWLLWLGLAWSGGMTLLLLWALVFGASADGGGRGGLFIGLLLFGIPAVLLGKQALENWTTVRQDQREQRVAVVSGLAQIIPSEPASTLKIGGETFSLPGEKASAFQPLESYRVYYLPNTRRIVSAERLLG